MILNGPGISYTEPDIGAEFVPPLPEHPREAIVKLCEHCTNRLLHRDELATSTGRLPRPQPTSRPKCSAR